MATAFMKQALDVLREAEVKLCGLIPKALAGHRDEEAGRLMELARLLADARCSRAGSGSGVRGEAAVAPASADTPRDLRPGRKRQAKGKKKRKTSPYPKFFREGNALLKLGWSRKSRSEYEHRAPREAVLAVAGRVADVASTRSRFTVEDRVDHDARQAERRDLPARVRACARPGRARRLPMVDQPVPSGLPGAVREASSRRPHVEKNAREEEVRRCCTLPMARIWTGGGSRHGAQAAGRSPRPSSGVGASRSAATDTRTLCDRRAVS